MLRKPFTAAWVTLGILAAILEAAALALPGGGDTLSEHLWWLLDLHPVLWVAGAGGLAWLARHILAKKP